MILFQDEHLTGRSGLLRCRCACDVSQGIRNDYQILNVDGIITVQVCCRCARRLELGRDQDEVDDVDDPIVVQVCC